MDSSFNEVVMLLQFDLFSGWEMNSLCLCMVKPIDISVQVLWKFALPMDFMHVLDRANCSGAEIIACIYFAEICLKQ